MDKNDIVQVHITDYTNDGEGVGKIGTFPLFVKDAACKDVVECVITKLKKTYGYAKILRILTPSPDRMTPECPVSRVCGGCVFGHISYEAELRFKTKKVAENLRRIGGFPVTVEGEETSETGDFIRVENTLGMESPAYYRNKAQVPVGRGKNGETVLGFYQGRSHDIVPCLDCRITFPEMREILSIVRKWMEDFRVAPYDEATGTGEVRHVLARKGFQTGEILVCLIVNKFVDKLAIELAERLKTADIGVRTLCQNLNTSRENTILGRETRTVCGPGYIEDFIGDVKFRISPVSFYQVNPTQTRVLYGKALEFASLTGRENVWDLYCGIGTISLFLAKNARFVRGVEIVERAIEDARVNAEANGLSNTEFFAGPAEEVLPSWVKAHPEEKIDVITVDPPRKGLDPVAVETILRLAPARIVYVSCDSATLARDLRMLSDGGYRIQKVQPVDMFPRTGHVETVVLLVRKTPDAYVRIKMDMEDFNFTKFETKATYEEIKAYVKGQTGLTGISILTY